MNNEEREAQAERIELSAAKLLWDIEEVRSTREVPPLTFSWQADWSSFSGRLLVFQRTSHSQFAGGSSILSGMVTARWRYARPLVRPTEILNWTGKEWIGTG